MSSGFPYMSKEKSSFKAKSLLGKGLLFLCFSGTPLAIRISVVSWKSEIKILRRTQMSRQKTKLEKKLNEQNPPSFKISGLIVMCVFGFLLFGFTPEANAGDISSTDMLMINILRPICEVMYIGSQAIQHITGALSNLF